MGNAYVLSRRLRGRNSLDLSQSSHKPAVVIVYRPLNVPGPRVGQQNTTIFGLKVRAGTAFCIPDHSQRPLNNPPQRRPLFLLFHCS